MIKPYLNLSFGARHRLEWLRGRARHAGTDWRKVRTCRYDTCANHGLSGGSQDGKPVWTTYDGPYFKRECFADACRRARVQHKGWYTDEDRSTARGIVARLPHGRFLIGYYWSDNGEYVYASDIYDNEHDAAVSADSLAQCFAEEQREYEARFRAAENLRYTVESNLQRLRECLLLRHQECMEYVREEIPLLISVIRNDREKLNTEYNDFN